MSQFREDVVYKNRSSSMHHSIDKWRVVRQSVQVRTEVHELQVGGVLPGGIHKK